jgi:hypothetical protein
MENKDEFLFTDIALQMFNTFMNASENTEDENKVVLETLFSSLSEDYGDNPFFMPAIIYAFMMHMNIIMTELAESNGVSINEIASTYTQHYNENVRERFIGSLALTPSRQKEMAILLEMEDDISKGND